MIDRRVRTMRTERGAERGAALVIVLLFMVVALILITSVLAVTSNEIRIAGLHRDSVRALELAHAGVQEAVRRIATPRFFFGPGLGTTQCSDGFTPSVALASGEALQVGICVRSGGSGITFYEIQADATVGVAVRRLSAVARVFINNIPPEIVLSRDFSQQGSSSVGGGDVYTETFARYQTLPPSSQRSFAGWFVMETNDAKCYRWPCPRGLNLQPGHRRLLHEDDPALSDLDANTNESTCLGTGTPVTGVKADDPTQTSQLFQPFGFDPDPELVEYVLGNTPSGVIVPPGGDFNRLLDASESTPPGSIGPFSVAGGGAPEDSFAFTPGGAPGTNGRGGNYAVMLNITNNVSSSVKVSIKVERVNSDGSSKTPVVESAFTAERNAQQGIMIFPLYDINLGQWEAGDRLKVVYRFRNTGVPPRDVTLETGRLNERVSVPFGTENAKTGEHPCGLPYKYVRVDTVLDDSNPPINVGPMYFKTVAIEHWFETYYKLITSGPDAGWNKRDGTGTCTDVCVQPGNLEPDFANNPQFTAVPPFPSDQFIQALIDQTPASQTRTGGGVITSGSGLDFGCPPISTVDDPLDPAHAPGCDPAEFRFIALTGGNYTINSNINGHGTIVVDGNLTMNGTLAWVGTIYVKGSVALGAGGATITGGLITKGATETSGNFKVFTGQDAGEVNISNEVTVVVISMWER